MDYEKEVIEKAIQKYLDRGLCMESALIMAGVKKTNFKIDCFSHGQPLLWEESENGELEMDVDTSRDLVDHYEAIERLLERKKPFQWKQREHENIGVDREATENAVDHQEALERILERRKR